ncbi:hypothetical protein DN328_24915 [Salmonella enterica subsp. enterica]|nr:hypothetical protein [Salmonella enterica subsp. enterica]
MTSLKTSIKTITYLSDTGCLEIQGASLRNVLCICITACGHILRQDMNPPGITGKGQINGH